MKKLFFLLTAIFFSLNLFAQASTPVVIIGKDKGSVPSIEINNVLYIDALAMAKKLGGAGEFSAKHKQLRLKINTFSALLTAGQKEVVINGENSLMSYSAQEVKGKIYAPVNLFLSSKLSDAISRDITLESGKIIIEKKFNISFDEKQTTDTSSSILFLTNKNFEISSEKKSVREVNATVKDAVLKRDVSLMFSRSDLIYKAEIKQCKADVCIRALLHKNAQNYKFVKQGNHLVLSAYNGSAAPAVTAASAAPVKEPALTQSAPSVSAAPAAVISINTEGAQELDAEAFYSGATATIAPAKQPEISPAPRPALAPSIHNNTKLRVVIDAGHGGKDPGAVRGNLQEKTINLDVAKQLTKILKDKKIEVTMTRDDDTFIPLHGRSKISNDYSADMFVSIHTNASKRNTANGFSVYFRSEKATDAEAAEAAALENEALQYEETNFNFVDVLLRSLATNEHINESSKLAGYVRRKISATRNLGVAVDGNNSIKQANFYVLKGVDSPAILVEMAYISNLSDRKQLATKDFRKRMAEGIAAGILDYAKAEGYLQ